MTTALPQGIALLVQHELFMASSTVTQYWWDRDYDEQGRPLRSDLRATAHELWEWACGKTRSRLGDTAAAAELMEMAVAQASAYLDKNKVPLNSQSRHTGLMRRSFWSVLQRKASRLQRMELVGGNLELSNLAADVSWSSRAESHVDYQRLIQLLSQRARTILTLRDAGYDWQEIAGALGSSPGAVKKSFFREINALQERVGIIKTPQK